MLDVHVVSHTHWDREWYLPVERFRQRLVALIDELLDDPPRAGEGFLLDGQTILLDDYLRVRPERRSEVTRLLRDGRLEAGPWFVLADELIPGGEALVRNLLEGRRVMQRLDAESPPVLYCPDSFGHPAALPAIALGFGIPLIVLWRGYGSARWPRGDTVKWSAPTGDHVVVYHLPQSGYEFGANLPAADEAAKSRWDTMRKELAGRSTAGTLLLLNGADHHARQRDRDKSIAALGRAAKGDTVHASSLREFAKRLSGRATSRLPVVQGELRDSYGYTWTLQGTFGTRAAEKRMNALAERALTREAEPWAALASRLAGANDGRRALTQSAWRTLLTAHPHDTLCGCSIDEVARTMELRVHSARVQAEGIRDDALVALIRHDLDEARASPDRWRPAMVIRNSSARPRSGVAIVELLEFLEHVPVGPRSAGASSPSHGGVADVPGIDGVVACQALEQTTRYDRTEAPRAYPDNDLVRSTRVAVWVEAIPGYGITSHDLISSATAPKPKVMSGSVTAGDREMRNGHLAVEISEQGSVTLTHTESGRRIGDLVSFEDLVDAGDLYTPSLRGEASTAAFVGAERVHAGPLRAEFLLHWRFSRAKVGAASEAASRRGPAATASVRLTLEARSSVLRLAVSGENASESHRLRLRLRSDVEEPHVFADAAFALVARSRLEIPQPERALETPPPTSPLHRYVTLFGKRRGATLFSDGLGEYEVAPDGSILVTLVRSVGELSRNDLPERPGHAGWPTPTPMAQCLAPFGGEFAVLLHAGRSASSIATIERTADEVLLPLTGATLRSALATPAMVTGAELEGAGLAFSALKESEDGEWVVARCVNLLGEPVRGRWKFGFPVREAQLARLDETPLKKIKIADAAVSFEAGASAIVTVLVR